MRLRAALALAGVVSCLGCAVAPDRQGPDYCPSAEGMRWEFDVRFEPEINGVSEGTLTKRVDGHEHVFGKDYARMVETITGLPKREPVVYYARGDGEGCYECSAQGKEYKSFPLPAETGTTWTMPSQGTELACRLVGRESVETGGATYEDCLKVVCEADLGGAHTVFTSYYAPEVGMVRFTGEGGGRNMDYTLRRFVREEPRDAGGD